MKRHLFNRISVAAVGVVFALAGCSDASAPSPLAPGADAQRPEALLGILDPVVNTLLGTSDTVLVLQRNAPLDHDITVSKVIGSGGGTLAIPDAGLTVAIPSGALSYPTTITVTALQGNRVAYEFGPHGTKFAKPVAMSQDLRKTVITPEMLPYVSFKAGYFSSLTDLLFGLLRSIVDELLPATADASSMVVRFNVSHFSGYLVAVDYSDGAR